MGDRYGSKWSSALPWVLLGRRTQYQPALDTSPAELLYGQQLLLPGDGVQNNGQTLTDLLQDLRNNAAKLPIQTTHNSTITPYVPQSAQNATHILMRKGKPTILGPVYEGPFEITQRIGKSCLKVRTGNWVNGTPRHELAHWNNCVPAPGTLITAEKAKRGRKTLNANAPEFIPQSTDP